MAARRFPNSMVASGDIVLISITRAPGFRPPATPFSPNSTCSTVAVSGTMVMTISLRRRDMAGMNRRWFAPKGTSFSHFCAVRSNMLSSYPARKRLDAIGSPMTPTPMNPNFRFATLLDLFAHGVSNLRPLRQRSSLSHRAAGKILLETRRPVGVGAQ